MPILTKELLGTIETPRGGMTYAALRALGVEFVNGQPQPWRHQLIGAHLSDEQWARVVAASKVYGRKTEKTLPDNNGLFPE
jgi:hypothetical protein